MVDYGIAYSICSKNYKFFTAVINRVLCKLYGSIKLMETYSLSLSLGHKNTKAPLILKVLEIIFLTFLTPKLPFATLRTILGSKRSRPPRKTPRNAPPLYVLPAKKNNIPDFQNQRCINSYNSFLCFRNLSRSSPSWHCLLCTLNQIMFT